MSYYYDYYIGYEKEGKIYPLGPYRADGSLAPALTKSRSFASDLHEKFDPVSEDMISDELRKDFEYPGWDGELSVDVKYLYVSDLPSGDLINRGYVLIDQVAAYEEHDLEDFYPVLKPEIYAAKLQNQIRFGENPVKKDIDGEEYTEPNASDFMYYAWINTSSESYEAYILRTTLGMLWLYRYDDQDMKPVILETEG